ncbi:ABC transporter ATP-binding protein [Buchananella hordeovulneris]|uniref:ABC transporter ATP-binding protein n=1 Tax=Buchananella hordeovulneris TaxID=52770 RepID=A0A1Q5PVU9_9ACTO|nr:ABC transporter ATP-binding protein [Buchananella hordeovulneris]OKL51708.1 ABC transporter ATP-binding protein [Buchananella hordeovulneris]RRD43168.1 ABC transporter ATP-binding protein [Buchananella hordeovulneris]RRD53171.1 ABC transporter ATP-binding protein [Buchananella hordeovulneris]
MRSSRALPPDFAADALLQARDLQVGYGDNAVCGAASFAVFPGQVLAVVGANGSGKSTLLRTCFGLQPALNGQVRLLGRLPDPRRAAQRAEVASDMQTESFFPSLTVREHLELVCYGHGVANTADVTTSLLTEFGLARLANSLPDQLSSGQRRRLALTAVLARPRQLLLLDEPEQRLDHATRRHLGRRLAEEAADGGAVVLVSHDPDLVAACAQAALVVGERTTLTDVAGAVAAITEGTL